MSEVVAEAVATEAAPAAEAGGTDAEILGGLGLLEQATLSAQEAPAEQSAAEESEPEKPKDPEKGEKKKTRREFEAFLMSESELAKPDGLQKAAKYWQRRQSQLDGFEIRIQDKGAKLAAERTAAESWFAEQQQKLEGDRATARQLVALSKRLQDPENLADVLDAIGEITGRKGAGREIWEKLAQFAIKGGRRDTANAEMRAMQARIDQLEGLLSKQPEEQKKQAEAAEAERMKAAIEQKKREVIASAKDASKYPELARQLAAMPSLAPNVIADVRAIRRKARESGAPVDIFAALGTIESALAKRARPPGETPASQASVRPAASVAATATSIAPSQARTSAVVRDMTQEERERDLAADVGYLASLGLT